MDVKLAFERLRLSGLEQRACSVPNPIEAPSGNASVPARVHGVTMPEPVLDESKVLTLIGERIAAGVAEHVGMHFPEPCSLTGGGDHVVDRSADHLTAALGNEQPR